MDTTFLLLARYSGRAVIPLELVCEDFFSHLSPAKLSAKVDRGEIRLPIVRIEQSQKAARGVHVADLAAWIDERRRVALHECQAFQGP